MSPSPPHHTLPNTEPRRGSWWSVVLASLAVSSWSAPATAQEECLDGRIEVVFVDNHAIFDDDDLSDQQPFVWAYRLANRLHVRTSTSFLESELLFAAGDCYDLARLDESERLLRRYPFLSTVDIYGVPQADGSWHVIVDTTDEWTTKVDFRFGFDEGLEFRGVALSEENVLGRGILASVFFTEKHERRDIGAQIHTPRLLGTRLDTRISAGRTRVGKFALEELSYPFIGEYGRLAMRQLFVRRDELFPYSLGTGKSGGDDPTHVLLPFEEKRWELTLAGRIGDPGNLTTFGLGISNEFLNFPVFPTDVEIALGGDFGRRSEAPVALTNPLARQAIHSSTTRLNLLVGQRNLRFEQRQRLDALSGIQDVPLGTDLGLTVGRSVGSSSRQQDADDLYTRLRFFAGGSPGNLLATSLLAVEGRQVFAGGAGGGWRDTLAEWDLLLYWQPPAFAAHTLFARIETAGGWEMDQPFQLTLGGSSGVRGYHRDDFPGERRIIATLEDRIYLRWPWPNLIDLGLTAFADAGQMWAGDAPFGQDTGWKAAIGAGLRFGFPSGTRNVVRLDVAFPVEPGGLKDWVLRISFADVVGLAGGTADDQLQRSRRIAVGPDLFTPALAR